MSRTRPLLRHAFGLALGVALLASAPGHARAATPLTCERIPQLIRAYFQKHISYGYLNEELRERTVEAYLERLDPSKTLLLEPEVEAMRASLLGVFHDIYGGDCSHLERLQADILTRYKGMEDYVRTFVSADDYAVDPEVMLVIDPDKRGYPPTEEARKALLEKLVHFQISNYLNTDLTLEKAKEKLIHRYELMTLRVSELEQVDIHSAFLDAFASSMDPHTHYFSAEAHEDFNIEMNLSLDGIGIALSSRDGYTIVEKVIPGGATDKLDIIRPKDKVISVAQEDGEFVDIIDMDLRHIVRMIRGKRGTKVHLRVLRQGENTETFAVTIVRDKINLEERSAKLRFEEVGEGEKKLKLAVIELPSFYGNRNPKQRQSSRDLRNLLAQVNEEKADGLLLDLSRNGGGLLPTAVEIAGFFIEDGGVVAVKGTDMGVEVLRDRDDDILFDGPMVVLTSRVSASASEIVAGAMKDYRRAILVGDDHTFGKGTVQSMVPLPPGLGALKVTTALFFRPGGDSTQHTGVRSDIILPSLTGTDDLGEAHQPYSLPPQSIEPFLDKAEESKPEKLPWAAVTPQIVEKLAAESRKRIEKDEQFAEIAEQLAKADERDGVVVLSEILEENKDPKPAPGDASIKPPPEPEGTDEDEPSAQQAEALRILGDYVRFQKAS